MGPPPPFVALGHGVRTQQTGQGSSSQDDANIKCFGRSYGELNNVPGIVPEMYYHTLLAQLGSAIVRYREYVTFHSEYTYPEYLIAYQRA